MFDVRNNHGGQLEAVLGILEYILPETDLPLIRIQNKNDATSIHSVEGYLISKGADKETLAVYAPAKDHEIGMRMAILCNERTVSASELFTSCLMDFGCAEVFGVTTYGKGLGQRSYRASDYYAYLEAWGSPYYTYFDMGYFVIPAFYYSPPISDNYHGVGVVPHHDVPLSEAASDYYIKNIPETLDNQLNAAVDFLLGDQPITQPSKEPTDGGIEDGGTVGDSDTGSGTVTRPSNQTQNLRRFLVLIPLGFLLLAALGLLIAFVVITVVTAVFTAKAVRTKDTESDREEK